LILGVIFEGFSLRIAPDYFISSLSTWVPLILTFWIAGMVLFYLDLRLARYVIDAALSIRHQKLSEGVPTYRILRRERQLIRALGTAALLITWLRRRSLTDFVDVVEMQHESER
jgi:uncharacterized membrane protein